jgi:ketosteroid isomerase-like protein
VWLDPWSTCRRSPTATTRCASSGASGRTARQIRAEKEEVLERGTDVLIVVVWRASGEGGIGFEQRAAFTFTLRDRLVTHVVSYWDPRDPTPPWAWNHPPGPAHSRYPCPPGARSSAG